MNQLALKFWEKSIEMVQRSRDDYLHLIEKEDIWESRFVFRKKIGKIVLEENSKTKTVKELETRVMQRVKEWIRIKKP